MVPKGIMKNKKYVQIQQVDGEDMDSVNMVTNIDNEIDDEITYDNSTVQNKISLDNLSFRNAISQIQKSLHLERK